MQSTREIRSTGIEKGILRKLNEVQKKKKAKPKKPQDEDR